MGSADQSSRRIEYRAADVREPEKVKQGNLSYHRLASGLVRPEPIHQSLCNKSKPLEANAEMLLIKQAGALAFWGE